MNKRCVEGAVPFVLAAAAVTALGFADTQFAGLGSLLPGNYIPGNFVYLSRARDVNFDGSVVVGYAASTANETFGYTGRRFRWTPLGGIEQLARPDFASGEPTIDGVTDDGRTVVGTVRGPASGPDPFNQRMLVQTEGQPPRTLLFVPGGGTSNPANSSVGSAVSGDGTLVAGSALSASGAQRATFWSSPSASPVGAFAPSAFAAATPPQCAPRSQVKGVSRNGLFAVGSEEQPYSLAGQCVTVNRAVRWTLAGGGGQAPLSLDPGSPLTSVATAVSQDGSVVVGQRSFTVDFGYDTISEMFRWTPQTGMVGLGNAPVGGFASDYAGALDVSADGRVVVGFVGYQAVVWDATHGLRTVKRALQDAGLNIGGWVLFQAEAVSGDGRVIVGIGENPTGQTEAWRAVLPAACLADFNGVGGVTIQDVFDFLVAYFAGAPAADINGRDGVTVQDVFDYLVAYFAGCA